MAKPPEPYKIAIDRGIPARLAELGFERRSRRLFVKQTGDYAEWVQFNRHAEDGGVSELYGVFDEALERFIKSLKPDGYGSDFLHEARPATIGLSAIDYARSEIGAAVEVWRANRRPWRPLAYFIEYPEDVHPYLQYVGQQRRWRPDADPEGCAAAMRASWEAWVEPTRARLLEEPKAVAREALKGGLKYNVPELMIGFPAYLGDMAAARAAAEPFIALDDVPPTPEEVRQVERSYVANGGDIRTYPDKVRAGRRRRAALAREVVEIIEANTPKY